ncbi:PEP-utilizing enzyme [Richelia sinica FACHB-800]|uniref:Phosphoenolpyruvate synthase n=1 Tax=Richelia sinica FACHB-800 TaxID=1357546 RepID=A0A975T9P8_9NOST|nr:putative PEP-binding protein [Richelia sinica]MBD2663329.1 phosphoenolpyruvate synthase [Richelia sinica FACHB-800]QXE24500.1 PEP-utilizing enzyme [Richelia sinica FACHB-800]
MEQLYWLDQIKLQDRSQVGEKAFQLSRISHRGYPVVPGFVVSAGVLRQFLENLNSSESLVADLPDSSLHLDVANWRQLQQVASKLRQEIVSAAVPEEWVNSIFQAASTWQKNCLIFRPTLSIATGTQSVGNISGLLESVFCRCYEEAIAYALKHTWSQLFRARSLLYWQSLGISLHTINLAVLVQPVENAIASGVLNANLSEWEIQAAWGLGLAITNGDVLPDIHSVQPDNGLVREKKLGNKMLAYCLDDDSSPSQSVLTVEKNCLVTYLLAESQQKQQALSTEYLSQVIGLGHRLMGELGTNFQMKWTITAANPVPQLYITQVNAPQPVIPNLKFIKGIGAARGRVISTAHIILDSQPKPTQIPKDVILVAPTVTPDWFPLLQNVGGIITEKGGLTSHGAILARELGIPAVVSLPDATKLLDPGEKLLIDGERGEVYRMEEEPLVGKTQEIISSPPSFSISPQLPIIATQLLVNLSQPSLVEQAQKLPVDGVGLLRSELMMLNILEGKHPVDWLLAGKKAELLTALSEQILQFVRSFAPRPVFYRSLDWRSPELPSFHDSSRPATTSMLGERGVFSYIRNPEIFELELQALADLQTLGYSNINLLLPFVRTVEEFEFCRQKVEQAGLTQIPQFQLWMMAEVPSVLFLLPEYIKAGAAGISIGTNDLTQLILGIDREQGNLAKSFDERHPAVMSAIAQLIKMAQAGGIPCSICGQAPALYPEIIDKLVEWGITSISVEPEAVERTYRVIARAEQRIILAAARQQLEQAKGE